MSPYDWQSDPDMRERTMARAALELIEAGGWVLLLVLVALVLASGPGVVRFQ